MFNCDLCGTTVPAHTPMHRVVLEARAICYPVRQDIYLSAEYLRKNRNRRRPRTPGKDD